MEILRSRYKGDSEGTAYAVVTGDTLLSPWTIVVCEDRPGLYSNLLTKIVESGVVGKGMTVPFTKDTVRLLLYGEAYFYGSLLKIQNLDQCILLLDMDCSEATTNLLPDDQRAFAGGELYRQLDKRIRDRTYLVSRMTPLKEEYREKYPELTRIRIHPSLEEKKEVDDPRGGFTLSPTTIQWINEFVSQTKSEIDQSIFSPIEETRKAYETFKASTIDGIKTRRRVKKDINGNVIYDKVVKKISISFAGVNNIEAKEKSGAYYLHMMLQHPGRLLSTSKMFSIRNPGHINSNSWDKDGKQDDTMEDEQEWGLGDGGSAKIDSSLDTWSNDKEYSGTVTQSARKSVTMIPDHDAIIKCCEALEININQNSLLPTKAPIAKGEHLVNKNLLEILKSSNQDAKEIIKYISSADYYIKFRLIDNLWKVTANPRARRHGRSEGTRTKYTASQTVRRAIDRFLKEEVAERLPQLHKYLNETIILSDESPSCQYTGKHIWDTGNNIWDIDHIDIEYD